MVQVFQVSLLLLAVLAQSSFAHICDICDCQPTKTEVFSITCGCEKTKHLQLTSSMMLGLDSTAMVVIKNCETVSVERNSFSQLSKLDTLGIQNCLRVHLATGAFSSLNSLLINNVKDISFGEMALMGARGIKNIFIHSSNITHLPRFSLYDVDGMDRFTINGVNIDRISKNAFNVSAKSFIIENSKIKFVESDGLAVQAQKVLIKNSEINTIQPDSIIIKTEFQTRLLENRFNNLFNMNITSPFAEFFGNHFYDIDIAAFSGIQMPILTNNFIFNTNLRDLLQHFNHKDFHNNEFSCNCNMNISNFATNSNNNEIIRNNYCMANCTLSLFDFEVESITECFRNRRVIDVDHYCTEDRLLKTVPVVVGLENNQYDQSAANKNVSDIYIRTRFLEGGNTTSGAHNCLGQKSSVLLGFLILILISNF